MHVYEIQYANSIDFSIHNDIDVVFLIIDLIVDVVKNIVDELMIMIFKCDYISYDKNDHWFKNCIVKYFHLKKQFENRIKIQKNRRKKKSKKK